MTNEKINMHSLKRLDSIAKFHNSCVQNPNVPQFHSTKYVPYPIYITIENIIVLCLYCGIANCGRYLSADPKLWSPIIVMVHICTNQNVLNPLMYPFCIAIEFPRAELAFEDSFCVPISPCPLFVFWQKRKTRWDKTRRDETRQYKLNVAQPPLSSRSIKNILWLIQVMIAACNSEHVVWDLKRFWSEIRICHIDQRLHLNLWCRFAASFAVW